MSSPIHNQRPKHCAKGKKWVSHSAILKHLRSDFEGRCAYCGDLDNILDSTYQVDHFAPKEKFKEREFIYENLMYACPSCNRAKSEYWVSDDADVNVISDEGIVNPCSASYDNHLCREDSGAIGFKTRLGKFMYMKLKLYLRRHHLIYKLEKLNARIDELERSGKGAEIVSLYRAVRQYYRLGALIKNTPGRIIVGSKI